MLKTSKVKSFGVASITVLFFAEMALSPGAAAVALLVPAAARWGAFEYVPAVVWLLLFVQCLFTFRWRGLWFLLGPPIAFFAIIVFLVMAPPAPNSAEPTLIQLQ